DAVFAVRMFAKGKWFLFDSVYSIKINDQFVGEGSVKKGFDINIRLPAGVHKVELLHRSVVPGPAHVLNLTEQGVYEVEFEFSRMWGDYSPPPKIRLLG